MSGALLYWPRRRFGAPVIDPGGGTGGGGGGGGTGGGSTLPSVAATWSDLIPQSVGVNIHSASNTIYRRNAPGRPALPGETAGQRAIRESVLELGVRHVRDTVSRNMSTYTQHVLNDLASHGVTALLVVGKADGSAGTVDECMAVVRGFASGAVGGIQGANEWNGGASGGGYVGWETDDWNWQKQLWAARGGLSLNAAPLAKRQGYSQQVNTKTAGPYSGICDRGDCHQYPGGWPPSKWIDLVITNEQKYVKPSAPCDVSETGFHNAIHYSSTTDTHYPTPEGVAGVYADRLILEHYRDPRVRNVYFYELGDDSRDDSLTDKESHFGLYRWGASTDPLWQPKPAASSVSRFLALHADQGSAYSPASLPLAITGGGSDLRSVLTGKRDGSYLLSLWRDVSIWTPANAGGTPVSVTPQNITVTLDGADVTRYIPSVSADPQGESTGEVHTVSLGANTVVLQIAA